MSRIKSFSVGDGDFFYVRSNSSNLTIIDCYVTVENAESVNEELLSQRRENDVCRFISTHPDEDHLHGIELLDETFTEPNFYCVANQVSKADPSESFRRYCELRDGESAYGLRAGLDRCWFTRGDEVRDAAGFRVLWPDVDNDNFKEALDEANSKVGSSPNNISPVLRYKLKSGASVVWAGDLETEFMESIIGAIELPKSDVVFAPHHGRKSGRIPEEWLNALDPQVIIIGEAPSELLEYYSGFNTITQNSAGDILLDCVDDHIDFYISGSGYEAGFLDDRGVADRYGMRYLGTLQAR